MLSVSFPTKKGDERLLVNGGPFPEPFNVEDDEVCTLQFLGYPLIVFAGKDPKAWADQIQKGQWILANGRTATDYAQCARYEVLDKIREIGADLAECAIKPVGLDVPFGSCISSTISSNPKPMMKRKKLFTRKKSSLIPIVVSSLARPVG